MEKTSVLVGQRRNLPQLFVEHENENHLRYRTSQGCEVQGPRQAGVHPERTHKYDVPKRVNLDDGSTRVNVHRVQINQFHTSSPYSEIKRSEDMRGSPDSGINSTFEDTPTLKTDSLNRNLHHDGSFSSGKWDSTISSNTSFIDFLSTPIQDVKKLFKSRASFLEEEEPIFKHKLQPQHVLTGVVLMVMIASVGFTTFLGVHQYNLPRQLNGKQRSIQYGTEQHLKSMRSAGRIIEDDIKDETGTVLGGKKASIQFAHDQDDKVLKVLNRAVRSTEDRAQRVEDNEDDGGRPEPEPEPEADQINVSNEAKQAGEPAENVKVEKFKFQPKKEELEAEPEPEPELEDLEGNEPEAEGEPDPEPEQMELLEVNRALEQLASKLTESNSIEVDDKKEKNKALTRTEKTASEDLNPARETKALNVKEKKLMSHKGASASIDNSSQPSKLTSAGKKRPSKTHYPNPLLPPQPKKLKISKAKAEATTETTVPAMENLKKDLISKPVEPVQVPAPLSPPADLLGKNRIINSNDVDYDFDNEESDDDNEDDLFRVDRDDDSDYGEYPTFRIAPMDELSRVERELDSDYGDYPTFRVRPAHQRRVRRQEIRAKPFRKRPVDRDQFRRHERLQGHRRVFRGQDEPQGPGRFRKHRMNGRQVAKGGREN